MARDRVRDHHSPAIGAPCDAEPTRPSSRNAAKIRSTMGTATGVRSPDEMAPDRSRSRGV